jgi:peptide/nickel transport system substrate-binding protein
MDSKQNIQPQMAESRRVENGGRTSLIRLRPGLMFHDGAPVRATDCVVSLNRWIVRDSFGQIVGRALDAFEAADDRTIRVKLKRPFPRLLDAFGKAVTPPFIMPERLAKTAATAPVTEMIGSGPYKFNKDEFVAGARVAYSRFDGYVPRAGAADWLSGGRKGWFERIEWHIIPDPATLARGRGRLVGMGLARPAAATGTRPQYPRPGHRQARPVFDPALQHERSAVQQRQAAPCHR